MCAICQTSVTFAKLEMELIQNTFNGFSKKISTCLQNMFNVFKPNTPMCISLMGIWGFCYSRNVYFPTCNPTYITIVHLTVLHHITPQQHNHVQHDINVVHMCKQLSHVTVEKSIFSIWRSVLVTDQFDSWCSPNLQMFVYMYLSQLMSTFTNYLKVHRSLHGFFIL